MISDTIAAGLEPYRIGPKLRALRKAKKLGLVQLGEHSGLSPGLLSKIERGHIVPTLPTLLRVALVFGVGLEHFFEAGERPTVSVVRRHERLRLPDRPGSDQPSYFFESLDFAAKDRSTEAYLADFPAGAPPSEPHHHDGSEFVYVIAGRLSIVVGDIGVDLDTGDAAHFDSATPHAYRASNDAGASVIVVVQGPGGATRAGVRAVASPP